MEIDGIVKYEWSYVYSDCEFCIDDWEPPGFDEWYSIHSEKYLYNKSIDAKREHNKYISNQIDKQNKLEEQKLIKDFGKKKDELIECKNNLEQAWYVVIIK